MAWDYTVWSGWRADGKMPPEVREVVPRIGQDPTLGLFFAAGGWSATDQASGGFTAARVMEAMQHPHWHLCVTGLQAVGYFLTDLARDDLDVVSLVICYPLAKRPPAGFDPVRPPRPDPIADFLNEDVPGHPEFALMNALHEQEWERARLQPAAEVLAHPDSALGTALRDFLERAVGCIQGTERYRAAPGDWVLLEARRG